MGDLTRRADRYVERMLRRVGRLEYTHPAEVQAVEEALKPSLSVDSRLRERRRTLRQHSAKGK